MSRYSLSALLAAGLLAGGLAAGSASAADLGGDCCADLEERVAELEATTVRKGNRKVSLTISGFVAQQVLAWDDGDESNVYITDTGSVSIGSHFKLSGEAAIVPGWTAGYVMKVEVITNDSLLVDQLNDDGIARQANAAVGNGQDSPLSVESSYWFVKSEQLGRLSLGHQSSAADNQAILPDGSGSLVVANYVQYDNNAFFLRNEGGKGDTGLSGLRWASITACSTLDGGGGVTADCDGYPHENIRYDTPTFAGFSGSASWGEDDVWAVSARYAGEWNSIKVAAAIAYNESTDEDGPGGSFNFLPDGDSLRNGARLDVAALQIGAYIQHVPTGLFLYGAYGEEYNDTTNSDRDSDFHAGDNDEGDDAEPEGDNWYVKAGIRQRWSPLGHTVLYGEYGENNDKFDGASFDAGVNSSEQRQYGLGVVQEIDAAAMSVWLAWRHYEADVTCDNGDAEDNSQTGNFDTVRCDRGGANDLGLNINDGKTEFEDLDIIKAGALISF